jgi:hypothetical protein
MKTGFGWNLKEFYLSPCCIVGKFEGPLCMKMRRNLEEKEFIKLV